MVTLTVGPERCDQGQKRRSTFLLTYKKKHAIALEQHPPAPVAVIVFRVADRSGIDSSLFATLTSPPFWMNEVTMSTTSVSEVTPVIMK